jgi:hypothetical protein
MAERFKMAMPVMDHAAEDDEMLDFAEALVRGEGWRECVEQAGGRPVGEPEVSREPNPSYGMVVYGNDDRPVLNDEGEPIVDHIKLFIVASGWAER